MLAYIPAPWILWDTRRFFSHTTILFSKSVAKTILPGEQPAALGAGGLNRTESLTGSRIGTGLAISIVRVNIYIYIYINISKKFGEHRKTPQINSVGQFRFDIKASICKGNIFCRRNIHLPVVG